MGAHRRLGVVRFPGYAASPAPTTLPCPPPVPGSALALLVPGRSLGGGGEDWRVREADRRRGLWGAEDYKRTHPARGRCPLGPAPTRSGLRMAAACCCLSLLLLSTCVALLLQPPLGAQGAPLEPVYPGDNATPEQMAQYAAELRRYINMLTRPRYGKRDREDTLDLLEWGSPHAAAPRELSLMDL
ncbi:Pancreatic prohormone [Manis javanica]|nr:Pancreatic prohormone [Manis javanica]